MLSTANSAMWKRSVFLARRARAVWKRTLVTADLGVSSRAAPAKKSNEDAWSIYAGHSSITIAVADGVSAWRSAGINPSLFPNQLVSRVANYAQGHTLTEVPDPSLLLSMAFDDMVADNETVGSCTICVAVIDRMNRKLFVTNVGDGGLLQLRNQEIMYKSSGQYVAKDVPYQLGINTSSSGVAAQFQRPSDADRMVLDIQPGDLITIGTDGLHDSLWPDEIAEYLSQVQGNALRRKCCLKRVAENLTTFAQQTALRGMYTAGSRKTPYVQKSYGDDIDEFDIVVDSNIDDVTVCLAEIKEWDYVDPAVINL